MSDARKGLCFLNQTEPSGASVIAFGALEVEAILSNRTKLNITQLRSLMSN